MLGFSFKGQAGSCSYCEEKTVNRGVQKMQSNKTCNLEKQNHAPRKQQQQLPPLSPILANGQQDSSQKGGLTTDLILGNQETFIQGSRLFVDNLPPDITEAEMRKLFDKHGKAGEVFSHKDKGFGVIHMEG
ncbi:LOW QUALITY PROTEIN: hypothetical protein QTO34_002283 [Cnephaeus nilssonii]|uniref:RRM domain-containing protein n=1 Tax=Cnephaeus nilssonii TaxID=3371016 RepID=A0AA40LLN8_CNENI|nr:LOW QUALITY PROTEIN: hypothetical protein QTO34_002283 [Eptesicus nilssonii]